MKLSLIALGLSAATLSNANIYFPRVQPVCDHTVSGHSGCLRGQSCSDDDICIASRDTRNPYTVSFQRKVPSILDDRDTVQYSPDGKCGPANNNLVCDPNSKIYKGTCCSQYGWCGNTADHCGTGCVAGCTTSSSATVSATTVTAVDVVVAAAATSTSATSTSAPRDDGRCGNDFDGATCDPDGAYGGCCSEYGYCGTTDGHCLVSNGCQIGCSDSSSSSTASTTADLSAGSSATAMSNPPASSAAGTASTQEPVLGSPTTSTSSASATGEVTTDGSCGANYGNTVCGNWPQGSCCSMYGYCGNTTSHCGDGCQSGPCINGAEEQAPGASPAPAAATAGTFKVVGNSGVPVMHAGLLPNGKVAFLDKIENYTQVKLANGQYAYSAEYDVFNNTYVPISYKTNAFCAGGAFLADGSFVSLGGNGPLEWLDPTVGDGFDAIRYLKRSINDTSLDGQGWSEPGNKLASKRWYATAQILADGSVFIASGSLNGLDPTNSSNNNPTWELLNSEGISDGINRPMEILVKNQPYYMYPFVHLLNDGSLFVFVSKSSERFDVDNNKTLSTFPDLPGDYRTYPNTGGSVMLPLSSANNWTNDIVICGGGAYQDITSPTDPSCGRISPLAGSDATWEMDSMPEGRGMVEGTMLPDGTIIWLNGCNRGAQGFGLGEDPTFDALLYTPDAALGQRWSTAGTTDIPRLYHSVALLLLDGTLMVTGSNPVEMPVISPNNNTEFPYDTEFRVEIYTPPYLQGDNVKKRPTDITLSSTSLKADSSTFTISFTVPSGAKELKVALYHGGFVTHSVHMGHRMLYLDTTGWSTSSTAQTITVTMPPNNNVAPPGPYVVYVVVDGVPAIGQTVMVA